MKQVFLWLAILSAPVCYAGGDSSAGSGGGSEISVQSGYTKGQFDITSFSDSSGIVGEVLKYYLAVGATKTEAKIFVGYTIPGQEADNALMQSKMVGTDDSQYYQLNWHVAYD